eukprot:TRINITY_DN9648_c0_g1_i1.p1 TRINITY_DN9648_c0_g1~~TRINITY_DN9648_c0_g1_i1.p1  ORF type:complete len:343 (+),score=12.64 TRINITY_DN9648_c0_g1_i1:136-1164(+)
MLLFLGVKGRIEKDPDVCYKKEKVSLPEIVNRCQMPAINQSSSNALGKQLNDCLTIREPFVGMSRKSKPSVVARSKQNSITYHYTNLYSINKPYHLLRKGNTRKIMQKNTGIIHTFGVQADFDGDAQAISSEDLHDVSRTGSVVTDSDKRFSSGRRSINLACNQMNGVLENMIEASNIKKAKRILQRQRMNKKVRNLLIAKQKADLLSSHKKLKGHNKVSQEHVKNIILESNRVPTKVLRYEKSLLNYRAIKDKRGDSSLELIPINGKMHIFVEVNRTKVKQEESDDERTYRLLPKYKETVEYDMPISEPTNKESNKSVIYKKTSTTKHQPKKFSMKSQECI